MCISIIQRNIQKQRHFRKIGIRSNSSVDSILKDRNILRDTLDESDVDGFARNSAEIYFLFL